MSKFSKTKEKLLTQLEDIRGLCDPGDPPVMTKQIEETLERLKKDVFVLVVVGQFKRGKSTLINALLGRELLPSAVIPLTSIITEISYGEREEAIIYFQNGSSTVTGLENLSGYITEKGNPLNEKQVVKAEVKIKADFLENGIVIVDTPGIGSTFRHNTDEAYNYLPLADAVVFVLSSDPPISQAEREYIQEITRHVHTMLFVLNKIDTLDQKELEEAFSFNQKLIREIILKDVEIFPLSAKRALNAQQQGDSAEYQESGLLGFKEHLKGYFQTGKARESLAAAAKRLVNLVQRLLYQRSLELSTARLSLEKLQEKQQIFLAKVQEINQLKEDSETLLKAETTRLLAIIQEDLEKSKDRVIAETKAIIKAYYSKTASLSVLEEYNELNAVAQKYIEEFYDNWRNDEEKKIQDIYGKILQRYARTIEQVIEEIHNLVRELFQVRINVVNEVRSIVPSLDFCYKFTESVELMNMSLLALISLLPKAFIRPSFRKRNLENIDQDVDRTCGRLRFDYSERIMKSLQSYARQLNDQYEEALNVVQNILVRVESLKEKEEQEQGDYIEKRVEDIEKLQNIKSSLCELMTTLPLSCAVSDEQNSSHRINITR